MSCALRDATNTKAARRRIEHVATVTNLHFSQIERAPLRVTGGPNRGQFVILDGRHGRNRPRRLTRRASRDQIGRQLDYQPPAGADDSLGEH